MKENRCVTCGVIIPEGRQVCHNCLAKMPPKKIYISGKITGTSDYLQRFADAEKMLKEVFPGVSVINPAKVNAALPTNTTYEQYMNMSFVMLDMCDTVYMMPGWEQSNGARREKNRATRLGLTVLYAPVNNENEVT